MVNCAPQVNLNAHYSTKEAAALLGIHRNSLRTYSDNGLIKFGRRKLGRKDKFFLGKDIVKFWKTYM